MSKKCPENINCSWLDKYPADNIQPSGKIYRFIKRSFDLFVVLGSSPFWAPLLLLIALAVKINEPDAPVLFYQMRTGKGGCRFKMYKFRTMVKNAEELKQKYMHLNELTWPDFKITKDPRVTRVGRILRKTSLDELPQVLNILNGDMSLVGPRPTSFAADTYHLWQTERLDVVPGITGVWQIIGRGKSEFDERLRMDIAYIERRCLRLDFEILWRTVISVLQQRGAV
jgi:lipopolysaccharide/colanic/teichoic acid biosynthesis glycosyltransferase